VRSHRWPAIAFAPLAEQQQIIGVLDEAFAGLATAQANAEIEAPKRPCAV